MRARLYAAHVEDVGVKPGKLDWHDVQFMLCEVIELCEEQP